ncbi:MAG: VWA domain-containing protein [Planctomycetota bacterium]
MTYRRVLLASTALTAALLGGVAQAQNPIVDPAVCQIDLGPGGEETVQVTVKIPGVPVAPKADIYILADNTGSMGQVLDSVKANTGLLVNALFGIPGADLRIGIGAYRDFPTQPQNQFAFDHRLSMSTSLTDIQNAVNTWQAGFGGDPSEGAFYALEKLSTDPAATYGWRPDAKRIIVWFGDAPSHDPVCTTLTGLPADITEQTVIAALQNAGPGGTTVIAISTPTNLPQGLNDFPAGANATNYVTPCGTVRGTIGQAKRIAAATGGIDTAIPTVNDITQAILTSLGVVFGQVTVQLKAEGGIVPLTKSILPPSQDVVLPANPNQFAEVTFDITFEGGPCVENTQQFVGGLRVCLNGQDTNTVKQVEITQTACQALCVWGIGFKKANYEVGQGYPGAADHVYIEPLYIYPVLMNQIPNIQIPSNPALVGAEIYTQVMMYNPFDFPNDPLQMSNAVMYKIGHGTAKFGSASGIQQWPTLTPQVGGKLGMGFLVEAMQN